MRAPVRAIRGRWPSWFERGFARFVRHDPRGVLDDSLDPATFRQVMSSFNVGDTIKITGANRHPGADDLLVDLLAAHDLDEATIVDIGASDGSTSLDLIRRLRAFRSYVIADLFLTLDAVSVGRRIMFFQADGTCVLIAGRRTIAWPGESRVLSGWFARPIERARRQTAGRQSVLLLNPSVRQYMVSDPRVSYRVHDIFQPWTGPAPDVIKVANLLRRLYFDDEKIMTGLRALLAGLKDGGHLLIVDNPRIRNTPPRGGLYRRDGDGFVPVAQTEGTPEIDDLIRTVSLASG